MALFVCVCKEVDADFGVNTTRGIVPGRFFEFGSVAVDLFYRFGVVEGDFVGGNSHHGALQ